MISKLPLEFVRVGNSEIAGGWIYRRDRVVKIYIHKNTYSLILDQYSILLIQVHYIYRLISCLCD